MNQKNSGFTIVELMLAMAFVAVLLIMIASSTIYVSHMYTKGITLRELNQVGRTVSRDLQQTIADSMPLQATYIQSTPDGGRFCTGRYTYIWNNGAALRASHGVKYDNGTGPLIRFARVADVDAQLCLYPSLPIKRDVSLELLSSGDRDLVVHSFKITEVSKDDSAGQALYAIQMVIGTNDLDGMMAGSTTCKTPAQAKDSGDDNYCAINSFDIVARAGSKI